MFKAYNVLLILPPRLPRYEYGNRVNEICRESRLGSGGYLVITRVVQVPIQTPSLSSAHLPPIQHQQLLSTFPTVATYRQVLESLPTVLGAQKRTIAGIKIPSILGYGYLHSQTISHLLEYSVLPEKIRIHDIPLLHVSTYFILNFTLLFR